MEKFNIQLLNGLGYTAAARRIKDGKEFDKYFPKTESDPTKKDPILKKDGSVEDTVDYAKKVVLKYLPDTAKIAQVLVVKDFGKLNVGKTCKRIFDFVFTFIQYEIDKPNVEQIRRPARVWSDRKADCDCMSIFVSSVLTNLNIPHSFRIVKMYGNNFYQHIYVVVPTKKGSTDYYIIDPVVDKFDMEAPKISFKKDFPMSRDGSNTLAGIPIQLLNGRYNNGGMRRRDPSSVAASTATLGNEFEGLEGFEGTEDELHGEWLGRMKRHLINTHSYITNNPARVSQIYNAPALAGAYKDLIHSWDSEHAREGTLDRLSAIEESFLNPGLQGLGDIIGGDDDRLFGIINADLNNVGIGDLGKSKKAIARKAAKAAKAPAQKRGVFTKIKQASKKVKAATKNAGSKVKKAGGKLKAGAKKAGKGVAKGALTPVRIGVLGAMKINLGKLGSRMYWGLFPQAEAAEHGVLPDYWQAANVLWEKTKKMFVEKLKGDEATLRKSIITGRAAKVAKRGTHGLGSIGELYSNGINQLNGFGGLGVAAETAGIIAAAGGVVVPLVIFAATQFKGKKKTANSAPDNGSQDPNDGGESEETSPEEATHIEDNYNNEVVENQPDQEPEADGSTVEGPEDMSGEREYMEGVGDLGKKIKTKKPATKKRLIKSKVERKANKAVRKEKRAVKKTARVEKRAVKKADKATKKAGKSSVKKAHILNALKNKKLSVKDLVNKLKKAKTYSKMTPAELTNEAIKMQSKTPAEIEKAAETYSTNYVANAPAGPASNSNDSYNDSKPASSSNAPEAPEAPNVKVPSDKVNEAPEADAPVKSSGNTGKILLGLAAGAAVIALAMKGKSKPKQSVNGLSGPSVMKKHVKSMLVAEGKKIQKKLSNQGERLKHGYTVVDKKKVRVMKIK